jgi:hypothetical protein
VLLDLLEILVLRGRKAFRGRLALLERQVQLGKRAHKVFKEYKALLV